MKESRKSWAGISGMTAILFVAGCCCALFSNAQEPEGSAGGDSGAPASVDTAAPEAGADVAPESQGAPEVQADLTAEGKKLRDPFCPVFQAKATNAPIDSTKAGGQTNIVVEAAPTGTVDWVFAQKQLKITGVSPDGKGGYFAVVNGQVVGAGDSLPVSVQGYKYIWVVLSISREKGLQLDRRSVRPDRGGN